MTVTLHHGDCIDIMRTLPDNSVDAIVTDPPYGLGFMGKAWDELPPGLPWATECLRVLKPGGHLLAFGGTRTFHRLAVAVEDAGFEIRDSIAWLYGSGFPKSLDVSKAIDKRGGNIHLADQIAAAIKDSRLARGWTTGQADRHFCGGSTNWTWFEGRKGECRPPTPETFARIVEEWPELSVWAEKVAEADREVVGNKQAGMGTGQTFGMLQSEGRNGEGPNTVDITAPATDDARTWQGWGTALKPAFEPIVVARKPLSAGTVAANVLTHGTGALNIDATRIGDGGGCSGAGQGPQGDVYGDGLNGTFAQPVPGLGRWPANVVLDESQADTLDEQSGTLTSGVLAAHHTRNPKDAGILGAYGSADGERGFGDTGGASRFFFTAREDDSCPSTSAASTAATPSPHPSEPEGSAPSGAATSANPEGSSRSRSREPSMSDTASESRPSGAIGTRPTPTTASESSPEWQPEKPSQMVSRARYAASLTPTDTTTTTTSPSTSDGSAELATSSSMPASAPGVPLDELASRFMYTAKADSGERVKVDGIAHPTVKPLSLMRWLVRLVTPPGGTVLEPFAGSGTTVEACILEGLQCIAIEREADYLPLIHQRINRRRDPVAAIKTQGEDGGLFDLLDGGAA